jgi:hypothetical protein
MACYVNTTMRRSSCRLSGTLEILVPEKSTKRWGRCPICLLDTEGIVPTSTEGERKIIFRCSEAIGWKHPAQNVIKLAQKILGLAWWQCSGSRVACYAAVVGCYEHDSHPTLPTHWTADYFLFPKMNLTVKYRTFDNIENIQSESQDVMKTLKRNVIQQCHRS